MGAIDLAIRHQPGTRQVIADTPSHQASARSTDATRVPGTPLPGAPVEALDGQLHTLFTSIDSRAAARNLAVRYRFRKISSYADSGSPCQPTEGRRTRRSTGEPRSLILEDILPIARYLIAVSITCLIGWIRTLIGLLLRVLLVQGTSSLL
jgi:hypothetical protein